MRHGLRALLVVVFFFMLHYGNYAFGPFDTEDDCMKYAQDVLHADPYHFTCDRET